MNEKDKKEHQNEIDVRVNNREKVDLSGSRETSLVANDKVIVNEGKILHNLFSYRLDNSEASQWMIANEKEVKGVIRKRFRDYGVHGGDVDDCYDKIIHEFNSRPDLEFNKNHFGEGTDYKIREYILNRVKYSVQQYRNKLNDGHKVVPFITNDESDYYFGKVDETMEDTNEITVSDKVVESDTEYWDTLFMDLMDIFDSFIEKRLYREFDKELYMIYMYLEVDEFDNEKEINKTDLDSHIMRVAKRCRESDDLVRTVNEDVSDAVRNEDIDGIDMLGIIQELLEGKNYGWKPKRIRESTTERNVL